jgi:hypothetical protein
MRPCQRVAFLALIAVLVAGTTAWAGQKPAPADKKAKFHLGEPLRFDPKDSPLCKLLKERFNEALAETKFRYEEVEAGRALLDKVFDCYQRLVRAGLEAADTPAERVALLKQNVDLAREIEKIVALQVEVGKATQPELHRARFLRLDAEIRLLRARKAKGGAEK